MPSVTGGMRLVRSGSYFASSRSHRYSILFGLPLLVLYEGLAALLARPGQGEVRNGADVLMRSLFTAVAGARGSLLFISLVILVGVALVVRDVRRSGERPRLVVFAAMLAESALLALAFGVVVGVTTAKLLGSLHALSVTPATPLQDMAWPTRLMLSLGAGLYEELFFRVLLVTGLATGARVLLGLRARGAGIVAAVVAAFIFAAFHYIGPYGDPLELPSFTFRMLSGLAFSGLYLLRGFGITAWTHALYDAFLLLG